MCCTKNGKRRHQVQIIYSLGRNHQVPPLILCLLGVYAQKEFAFVRKTCTPSQWLNIQLATLALPCISLKSEKSNFLDCLCFALLNCSSIFLTLGCQHCTRCSWGCSSRAVWAMHLHTILPVLSPHAASTSTWGFFSGLLSCSHLVY